MEKIQDNEEQMNLLKMHNRPTRTCKLIKINLRSINCYVERNGMVAIVGKLITMVTTIQSTTTTTTMIQTTNTTKRQLPPIQKTTTSMTTRMAMQELPASNVLQCNNIRFVTM